MRRLLSHTAGISVPGFAGYSSKITTTLPTLIQILKGNESLRGISSDVKEIDLPANAVNSTPVEIELEPGSKEAYSGGGITIVQKLIEDITGESYAALAKKHIFDPFSMTSSSFDIDFPHKTKGIEVQEGHLDDGATVENGWNVYPESGAAGLWTTSEDLAKFSIAVQKAFRGEDETLLSQSIAEQMLTRQSNSMFGLGFVVYNVGDELVFMHAGSNKGYSCLSIGIPRTGASVVIMTNSDNGSPLTNDIARSVFNVYTWPGCPLKNTQKQSVVLGAKILKRCAGKFKLTEQAMAILNIEDSQLFITIPYPDLTSQGTTKLELTPESDTAFFNIEKQFEITFNENYSELTINHNLTATRILHASADEASTLINEAEKRSNLAKNFRTSQGRKTESEDKEQSQEQLRQKPS